MEAHIHHLSIARQLEEVAPLRGWLATNYYCYWQRPLVASEVVLVPVRIEWSVPSTERSQSHC